MYLYISLGFSKPYGRGLLSYRKQKTAEFFLPTSFSQQTCYSHLIKETVLDQTFLSVFLIAKLNFTSFNLRTIILHLNDRT